MAVPGELSRTAILAVVVGGVVLSTLSPPAAAEFTIDSSQSAEETGLAIAVEADDRDAGFKNFVADMSMLLRNKQGQESVRELRIRTLEVVDDGDKSLVIFDTPRDIKGTAFLSHSHRTGQDDQWLYLPALKRTKRISSNNKSGPFMGSEFAYEDISSQEVDKYTYKYLGEETLDGTAYYKVERYPVDKKSGYTKQIVWFDQVEFRIWRIEFYDRKDELLKTLTYSDFQQYVERYWRADNMFMENHQTGKSTLLVWRDYEFQVDVNESDFESNALKRAR